MRTVCFRISAALAGVVLLLVLSACGFAPAYSVDYGGMKDMYTGARDAYRAGSHVTLYVKYLAMDVDYSFSLDGEPLSYTYNEKKGMVISFVMPEHDVKLECTMHNSMEYRPEPEPGDMLVNYYTAAVATVGGDDSYELVLCALDEEYVRLDVYTTPDGGEEQRVSYKVPREAADRCMEAIEENGLPSWESLEDAVSVTGGLTVCRFRNSDGTYTRVSSEHMPEDGLTGMNAVRNIIESYISDDCLLEDSAAVPAEEEPASGGDMN